MFGATHNLIDRLADLTAVEHAAGRKNMLQLIQLRWIAVVGQITTIAVVILGFDIAIPLPQMLQVLVILIAFNVISWLHWRQQQPVTNGALFFALLVDVTTLTAQLYFSGGMTNPFAFLFLLQVILSAVLLETWATWSIVAITSACLGGLALMAKPLALPADRINGLSNLYLQGLLICFVLNACLLVVFITRIHRNVRAGDAEVANLRQRAAEEDHIVRIGLLASGAAHELGTPLATLSVILGDWQHMPVFTRDDDLRDEIREMQAQLQRCKTIVSGILLAAGEARGESSVKTTINTFLRDLTDEWRASRPVASFVYENHITHDIAVVFDVALKQMIWNVLDNAIEASPHAVHFSASRNAAELILRVSDEGPGFPNDMLSHIGKPYQSSKGRPGSGLGLFFAVNVARRLGGAVAASNRPHRGAEVQLTLPIAEISLETVTTDAD